MTRLERKIEYKALAPQIKGASEACEFCAHISTSKKGGCYARRKLAESDTCKIGGVVW